MVCDGPKFDLQPCHRYKVKDYYEKSQDGESDYRDQANEQIPPEVVRTLCPVEEKYSPSKYHPGAE